MATERKRLYTILNTGNAWLKANATGWTEDAYRDLLARNGATQQDGRYSAATMNLQQLELAKREMEALGFKPKRKPAAGNWRNPRIAKLNAIWCALADAGVVGNRSQEAMAHWCENQISGMTKLHWATSAQLNQAVEMLKAWANRMDVELK